MREAHRLLGNDRTAELIDEIKRTGFYYMKIRFVLGMDDLLVPSGKICLLKQADEDVENTSQQYREGLLTEDERYNRVVKFGRKFPKNCQVG